MFRNDVETLAKDLSTFIDQIVQKDGFNFKYKGNDCKIKVNSEEGSPTDISILLSSPLEITPFKKKRLPHYLRENLNNLKPEIPVFNPRGQNLRTDMGSRCFMWSYFRVYRSKMYGTRFN